MLEREALEWKLRLRWDYSSSTELLLQYLDARQLPGFVTLDRGRLCGFAFCVYEGHKAVIGDVYAMAGDVPTALNTARTLLWHLLEMLLHSPGMERIESQLLLYDAGAIDEVFTSAGFTLFPRQFLELDLGEELDLREEQAPPAQIPPDLADIELMPWSESEYNRAAELIHLAYSGHIDAQVNDQYRTLHGSLRFLHNIVRFPGCGIFAADASWLMRERASGALVGMVLCSDVGDRVAHVTQLCVDPARRGHGLARRLMRHCATHLAATGFEAMTLTVTEANRTAVRLYDELGFRTRHRFDAMVWEKPKA